MTFYIDDSLNLDVAKEFDAFIEATKAQAMMDEHNVDKSLSLDLVIDSQGGEVRAADLIYHKIKSNHFKELNVIIIGQASSSAFDLVLLLSKLPFVKTYIGASCFFCIHKMDGPASTRSEGISRFYKESQNDDLDFMLNCFGSELTRQQVAALKRGDDIFLSVKQVLKILNGELIR